MDCLTCTKTFETQRSLSVHLWHHFKKPVYRVLTEKKCCICKVVYPLNKFRRHKNGYYTSSCRMCELIKLKEYRQQHPEWQKRNMKKSYENYRSRVLGDSCEICGENRVLDKAHIVPRKGRIPSRTEPSDNLLGLCPNHHRLFDRNLLNEEEVSKIKKKIEIAKGKYE